jgi:hypothetical protein
MASKAATGSIAIVEGLKSAAGNWAFLWDEYQASRSEAAAYWCETVSPAQAKMGAALNGSGACTASAAAARALALHRAETLRAIMDECEASERRHEALLEETCRLQEALLSLPAPTEAAFSWKVDQFLGCPGQISEKTRRVLDDDACRFSRTIGIEGAAP